MNKLILTLFCLSVIFSSCEHRVEELFINKTFNQIELLAKSKYELEKKAKVKLNIQKFQFRRC